MISRDELTALMDRMTRRIVARLKAEGCEDWPSIERRFRETWPELELPAEGVELMLPHLRREFDAGWRDSPEEVSFVEAAQWGEWLYQTLLREGAREPDAAHWAFALGQRIAGADHAARPVDLKALAEQSLSRWRAGETEPSKEVLAIQLFREAVGLPPAREES